MSSSLAHMTLVFRFSLVAALSLLGARSVHAQTPPPPSSATASRGPGHEAPALEPDWVGAGAGALGGFYLLSAAWAGVLLIADSKANSGLTPLFVPVYGPFKTISTSPSHDASTAILVADGVLQSAGVVMMLVGAMMDSPPPPAAQRARATPLLAPEMTFGGRAGALRWRF